VTKPVSSGYLASLWDAASVRRQRTSLLELADRFGKWFTVGAVGIAVLGGMFWLPDVGMALTALSAVLIIACPCALTLAAPATLGTAMAVLGRRGTFVKNIGVLLDIAATDTIVFDKTGTLTATAHDLSWIGQNLDESKRSAIAGVAMQSTHPVSRSIERLLGISGAVVSDVAEHVGAGISGTVDGKVVAIGSSAFAGGGATAADAAAYVSIDGRMVGTFVMRPRLREGVRDLVTSLRSAQEVYLVSGDSERDAPLFRDTFGSDRMRFGASPFDKINVLEQLGSSGGHTMMIGDGLNDAGGMRAARVGVAVSDETSTLVPACDVIIGGDHLRDIAPLIGYARRLRDLIRFSLVFSMVYNVIGVALAVSGALTPVVVAIMMPISSLIVTAVSVLGARWFGRQAIWAS
ncbi:MAG: HAD-IC family P-type ATPase, partial [Candidatus Kapabacteria bacterium]|nr:HAD-IC family P-type ATPase [Candidatus Kapabacteria bacterium]